MNDWNAQVADFAKPGAVTEADIRIDIEVGSFDPFADVGRQRHLRMCSVPQTALSGP